MARITDANSSYKVIPVVSPVTADPSSSGRVRNLHVGGGVCHAQLEENEDGSYSVNRLAERDGWMLLEDAYRREDDPEGWAYYQRYLTAWADNKTRSPFPRHRLPKSVQERQRCLLSDEFADDFRSPPTTGAAVDAKPSRPREARS